ncbi:hypothetical protein M5C90_26975 [Pseudomonas chlororaphis subsp. piscium]|nr:hypothetical protein M5C90_26975 [Pseudomonas chlororaphis subsp. piscium]
MKESRKTPLIVGDKWRFIVWRAAFGPECVKTLRSDLQQTGYNYSNKAAYGNAMNLLIDFVFNTICYWVGFWVLKTVTLGRFTGESSYWFGLVCALGALVLLSPFIIFIALKIMASGG